MLFSSNRQLLLKLLKKKEFNERECVHKYVNLQL